MGSTPKELGRFLNSEVKSWGEVIRTTCIKLE